MIRLDSIKVGAKDTFFMAQMICEFGVFDMPFGANEILHHIRKKFKNVARKSDILKLNSFY